MKKIKVKYFFTAIREIEVADDADAHTIDMEAMNVGQNMEFCLDGETDCTYDIFANGEPLPSHAAVDSR